MKTAVLAYQYGMMNAGDFAINLGSLDLLCDFFDRLIVVSKLTGNDDEYELNRRFIHKYYGNIEFIEGPFKLDRVSKLGQLRDYLLGLTKYPYLVRRGRYREEIEGADIVFLNGGNLLRCEGITDFVRLVALIFPLAIAKRTNVPTVFLPQSTTSLNIFGRVLLTSHLNRARIVFAREGISGSKLRRDFPHANILDSLDMAFFIKDRDVVKREFLSKFDSREMRNSVCITIRKATLGDLGELDSEKQKRIRRDVESLIRQLLDDHFRVKLVIQTKKDRQFTEDIYRCFASNPRVSILEEYDPFILREIYRHSSGLIGMRLHSLILAMSVGTPVVGYFEKGWGDKNPGTLGQYGMPYRFIGRDPNLYSLLKLARCSTDLMIKAIADSKERVRNALKSEVLI